VGIVNKKKRTKHELIKLFQSVVWRLKRFKNLKSRIKQKRSSLKLQDNTQIYSASQHFKYTDFQALEEDLFRHPNRGSYLSQTLEKHVHRNKVNKTLNNMFKKSPFADDSPTNCKDEEAMKLRSKEVKEAMLEFGLLPDDEELSRRKIEILKYNYERR
jgi:hypothetical protein